MSTKNSRSFPALGERKSHKGTACFEWDGNNRIEKAVNERGQTTLMGYDAQGRRIFKQTDGIKTTFTWDGDRFLSDVKTTFFWDGDHLLSDRSPQQGVREFVYYPDTFEPLAYIDKSGSVYYYQNDNIGLPQEVVTATGRAVWSANFGPLGALEELLVNEVDNPIRFQGQYYDAEIDLHYNRFRYYDSKIGSFINQDPIRLEAGVNLYRYAPNTWGWIDPFGLSCAAARRSAVRKAWKEEADLVRRTGKGSRAWTKAEIKELLGTGKVKGYQGHHVKNVQHHPHLAGDPRNIRFMTPSEHLAAHGGNWRNKTTGKLVKR